MSRSGPRPHTWKVQGELNHTQYVAWLRMKAQAQFRKEGWALTFEQYQAAWQGHWDQRGRAAENLCLTRKDNSLSWNPDNVVLVTRREHLRRQGICRTRKNNKWQKELTI